MTAVALEFGPAEYFSLVVLGLISSVALAHGSVLKALAMIVLGLLLGLVGTDIYTGEQRFTLGRLELADGINFVAVAVGVFGIAEILRNLEKEHDRDVAVRHVSGLMPSRADLRRIVAPVLRGTALGSLLGILPGGGHVLASFAAYTVEKKVSRTPERFGKGAIEGVAAPESANNAAAQTSFIPMLTLGIPANPVMALMIGAMIIQGITPGPNVATDEPALFWGLIVSMWMGNLLLVVLNLPLIGLWVRMLSPLLCPVSGDFRLQRDRRLQHQQQRLRPVRGRGLRPPRLRAGASSSCEPAPLLLGFVLGPMLEEHLRRAMIIARGDPLIFLQRPISAVLLGLAVLALAIVLMPNVAKKRDEVFHRGGVRSLEVGSASTARYTPEGPTEDAGGPV